MRIALSSALNAFARCLRVTVPGGLSLFWLAPFIPLIAVFVAITYVPAQYLHGLNHSWAMGQSAPVVWGLMIWDSLLVGLMACWMGAGLAAGYWLGRPPAADAA